MNRVLIGLLISVAIFQVYPQQTPTVDGVNTDLRFLYNQGMLEVQRINGLPNRVSITRFDKWDTYVDAEYEGITITFQLSNYLVKTIWINSNAFMVFNIKIGDKFEYVSNTIRSLDSNKWHTYSIEGSRDSDQSIFILDKMFIKEFTTFTPSTEIIIQNNKVISIRVGQGNS